MYKIGIIGDYESICGFAAPGADIYPVKDLRQAREELERLAAADYGVIYITESVMEGISEETEKYRERLLPAIVPIPSVSGVTGFGRARMKRYVEQAVGSDIIYNDE